MADEEDAPEYLYHVTMAARLPGIAEHGLRPGMARSIGTSSYDGHRKGGIFFTEWDGVAFWANRAELFAENESDDPLGDELVPVVLRVASDDVWDLCEEDEVGTKDSGWNQAFKCKTSVPPEGIELYDGEEWVPVEDYGTLELEEAFNWEEDPDAGCDDEEEDPEECYGDDEESEGYFIFKMHNPFIPEEE